MNQDELKVLEERIKANPKSRSFLQLAEAYIEMGRRSEALELLKNGEEFYPYYLAARIAYGKLLREEGDIDLAIEQFEFVNRTIPDNLLALKNLAELYLTKDRFPEAADMANAAIALSPNDPEMLEVLAKAQVVLSTQSHPDAQPQPSFEEPQPETEPEHEETIVEMPHELFAEAASHSVESTPFPESSQPDHVTEPQQEEPVSLEAETAQAATSTQDMELSSSKNLPQTETMGDLLFDQGHLEEALSVYEATLAKDPQNSTLPEKVRTVKTMLRLIEPSHPSQEAASEAPAEPVQEEEAPQLLTQELESETKAAPEPEKEGEVFPSPPEPEMEPSFASTPEPEMDFLEPETARYESPSAPSFVEGLAGMVINRVQERMGRELIGYVRSTLDGLSTEASANGHWADVLAAEGVEIVRAVSDMTRMLNWGELQGTVVWMDRAVLYGLPVDNNEALFLALKPGANVGLCRLLIAQVIATSKERENQG